MAKTTIVQLIDDTDGGEAHETVVFELDGKKYTIDLSTKNAAKLRKLLKPFVERATKVAPARKAGKVARARRAVEAVEAVTASDRAWLQDNYPELGVGNRGRLSTRALEVLREARAKR